MKTLKVTDFDGLPLFYAGLDRTDLERIHRKQVAKAHAHKCLVREIPQLGAPAGQRWCRDFKVTERDGIVVGIETLR